MCGRFAFAASLPQVQKKYQMRQNLNESITLSASYNIAPMQYVWAIVKEAGELTLKKMRWGLVPNWSKEDSLASKMINARAETLAEKPAFRNLIAQNRCLILADSFYEFETHGKQKRPVRFVMPNYPIFAFAGLYDVWENPLAPKNSLLTCTIITTEPNELIEKVHHRMAVILSEEGEREWLDEKKTKMAELQHLLVPFPSEEMHRMYVNPEINSPKNNNEGLIEVYDYEANSGWSLF
jgi:putative SOS response-associated peptidase YedK